MGEVILCRIIKFCFNFFATLFRFIFAAPSKMLKQMGLEAEVDMDNVVDIDKVKPLFDVEILFKLMI